MSLIFVYLVGFWVSLGGTLAIYTPEIVPETGVAICVFAQWCGAWVVTFTFPILKYELKNNYHLIKR